jgi:protein O-GlcNAc transferase
MTTQAGADSPLSEAQVEEWRSRIRADTFSNYHYRMGVAIEQEGDLAAAAAAYRRATDIRADLWPAHFRLESVLRRLGDTAGASAADQAAGALRADYKVQGAIAESNEHLEENRLDKAWEIMRGVLESLAAVDRTTPQTRRDAGEIIYRIGLHFFYARRFHEAYAVLAKACDLHPDIANAYGVRACIAAGLGLADEATALFRKNLQLDAGMAWTHVQYAALLLRRGEHAAAVAALEQARVVADGPGWLACIDGYHALALLEHNRTAEAEAACGRALQANPNDLWALVNMAAALTAQGRRDEALRLLQANAGALDPQWAALHFQMRPAWAQAYLADLFRELKLPTKIAPR